MKRILYLTLFIFVGCSTVSKNNQTSTTKQSKKTIVKADAEEETKYVPSGTQIEFHQTKKFSMKDSSIKLDISANKKCTLTAKVDKEPEIAINEGALLTVVGYREETNELIMTDSNYHQLELSCLEKSAGGARIPGSVAKGWQSSAIEVEDIKKMGPLLIVRFLPL